jgi:hypothetical protein
MVPVFFVFVFSIQIIYLFSSRIIDQWIIMTRIFLEQGQQFYCVVWCSIPTPKIRTSIIVKMELRIGWNQVIRLSCFNFVVWANSLCRVVVVKKKMSVLLRRVSLRKQWQGFQSAAISTIRFSNCIEYMLFLHDDLNNRDSITQTSFYFFK